jgi:predicted CXXCH cytochrome family protein
MSWLYRPMLLCAVLVVSGVRLNAGEHPVPLEKNTDAAKCLECHEDKSKGAHVHTAISMGCTTCHEVKVEKETTNVELVSPKEELCFTCHDKPKAATLHGPYEKGQCVLCHDPHVSDNDKQLRAAGNALCLECHRDRTISGKLSLFKTDHEFTEEEFAQIPKIDLDPTLRMGHPMGMHKVDGPDPVHPGQKMSCLTCHENHAAERDKLVRTVEVNKQKMDVCDACHNARSDAATAAAQKRALELEAQRQKKEELRNKGQSSLPMGPPRQEKKDEKDK